MNTHETIYYNNSQSQWNIVAVENSMYTIQRKCKEAARPFRYSVAGNDEAFQEWL